MHWLSNPKVRLGLIVNGLYFISLFTPSPPHTRSRMYAHTYEKRPSRWATKTSPVFAPLPPPTGPSKAETNYVKEADQLDVYLTNDLTLVSKPGHRLLFSPTFTVKGLYREPPRSVLLRFASASDRQFFDNDTPMVITADGVEIWRYGTSGVVDEAPSNTKVLHSVTFGKNSQLNETVGHEIPYEAFFEIINARQVIIELGPDRVELTADQIEALRDLHRRLLPTPTTGGPTITYDLKPPSAGKHGVVYGSKRDY